MWKRSQKMLGKIKRLRTIKGGKFEWGSETELDQKKLPPVWTPWDRNSMGEGQVIRCCKGIGNGDGNCFRSPLHRGGR